MVVLGRPGGATAEGIAIGSPSNQVNGACAALGRGRLWVATMETEGHEPFVFLRDALRLALCLACVIAPLVGWPQAPDAGDELSVEVAPTGDGVLHIQAHALVRASYQIVWNTLTDYGQFSRFVPGLSKSHLVSCDRGQCVVEQNWHISVLRISIPVDVTVLSEERPPSTVMVHLLRGNLKRLDGAYEIPAASDGRIDLRWEGIVEGPALLPQWVSLPIVRTLARDQFRGMVAEIEQRAAASGSSRTDAEARNPSAIVDCRGSGRAQC